MKALFIIKGIVLRGDSRGKELGFPTANIALQDEISEGIYAAEVLVDNKSYQAASFVGAAKTFDKSDIKLESYLFDFFDDLYGKEITVKLYKKIRDNKKFDSIDKLVQQMHEDVAAIKKYFLS